MNKRQFRICRTIITMAVGASMGASVASGNAIIPLITAGAGIGLLYLCKRRTTEVIEDERTHRITERASRITLGVFAPSIAVLAAVVIALSKSALSGFEQAGLTLAYSACGLMVLYNIFYIYYEKKS